VFKEDIEYSLVIPCYNESDNLPNLVDRCLHLLKKRKDIEVLLVDNGSVDDTCIVLNNLLRNLKGENLRSIRIDVNQGYGFGVVSGLKECYGSVIGWTLADLQTDPVDFVYAVDFFSNSENYKEIFVKGSRKDRPLRDVVFTWGMSLFERLILGVNMWDINAQPTVFSKDFFNSLENLPDDFSLDLFVFYEAINRDLKIQRFPVNFGLRLKGDGHNESILSKLKYSYKTMLFSMGLRRHLKKIK